MQWQSCNNDIYAYARYVTTTKNYHSREALIFVHLKKEKIAQMPCPPIFAQMPPPPEAWFRPFGDFIHLVDFFVAWWHSETCTIKFPPPTFFAEMLSKKIAEMPPFCYLES